LSAVAAPAVMAPSAPQHLTALARANRVRLARAELKRRIGNGELSAADVLLACTWEVESMTVADLLASQRRWGATRCRKLLLALQISETRHVGALTERQRVQLAERLRSGACREPELASVL